MVHYMGLYLTQFFPQDIWWKFVKNGENIIILVGQGLVSSPNVTNKNQTGYVGVYPAKKDCVILISRN